MRPRSFNALHAALLTLGVLIAAYGRAPAVRVVASAWDGLVFRHFHALETAGGRPYHWSAGASSLVLPQVGRAAHGLLRLQVWSPATLPPTPLTLDANQRPLVTLPIQGRRTITLLAPGPELVSGDVRIALHSPTWSLPDDRRPLGVAVEAIDWNGVGWILPPVRQLWALPGFVLLLTLLLARLRWPMGPASAVAALLGALLASGAALRPLAIAPYTHRLLLLMLLAHAGLLLWRALARDARSWWRLPARVEPEALLSLLGIAYWMCLPYQGALCAETGAAVCPRYGTQLIGSVTLATLLALAIAPEVVKRDPGRAGLLVLALSGVAQAGYATAFALQRHGPDFFIHWRAAYDVHLGRPLYRLDALLANHFGHAYKLPPFYVMLLLPFATADDTFSLLLHRVFNLGLYGMTGWLFVRLLRPQAGRVLALATLCIVMGLMQPAYDTIAYGQVDIMLLSLLVLALFGLRSDRPWVVGLTIALATLLKLYPALLAGFLLVRRAWRALAWMLVALVLLTGIASAVLGWQTHVIYLTQVLPHLGGGTSWIENQTINGFLSRLLTGTMRLAPIHDRTIDLLTYGGFIGVMGVTLLVAAGSCSRRSSSYALQFSIFAVAMALAIPAAWMHYATITIPAFVILVWHAIARPFTMRQACALALAFGLISYGNQWSFFTGTLNPGLPLLALSYKGYGLILLWGVMVATIWQARDELAIDTRTSPAAGIAGSLTFEGVTLPQRPGAALFTRHD
jgi:hypothetical protein